MTTVADVPTQREGFARSLVANLFPTLRKQHSGQYATDVQFIYDWESSISGGTRNDPLNLRVTGDYATPHDAMLAATAYVKAHSSLNKALSHGDYGAAKKALPSDIPVTKNNKMPSKIDPNTGDLTESGVPSLLDEIGGTLAGMPAQAGKDAGSVGSLLSKNMVLVVLVVALLLVLLKK